MTRPLALAKKIARGLNFQYGTHIVINTSEFYNENGKMVRLYVVKDAYYLPEGGYINRELFKTASQVYTVLFMRDLLYAVQGKEIDLSEDPGWAKKSEDKQVWKSYDYILANYIMDDIVEEVVVNE